MNSSPPTNRLVFYAALGTLIFAALIFLALEASFFQGHSSFWSTSVISKDSGGVLRADIDDKSTEYTGSGILPGLDLSETDTFQDVNSNSPLRSPIDEDIFYHPSSCSWSSDETHACYPLLFQHMQASLNGSRSQYLRSSTSGRARSKRKYVNRRWLFLGDSTIYHLFFCFDRLSMYLIQETIVQYQEHRQVTCIANKTLDCSPLEFTRCNIMSPLSLEPAINWELPNYAMGEGPLAHGLENAFCTDCSGCESKLLTCSLSAENGDNVCADGDINGLQSENASYTGPAYGGFAAIEFARDVELQSTAFRTTQENWLSLYIAQNWNSPELVEEFGRPICVASAGIHDCIVPNITKGIFIQNVRWYLNLIFQQCDYLIWIGNNCPLTDNFVQTKSLIYEWNMAVQEVLLSSPFFRQNSFYLDVFNSSTKYPHDDNMHMDWSWYGLLASLFRTLMDSDIS